MATISDHPVATTANDADVMLGNQSGTTKQFPLSVIRSGQQIATGPAATTENKLAQWDATTLALKDGPEVVTSVAATATASDSKIPTEKAVRELAETLQRWVAISASDFSSDPYPNYAYKPSVGLVATTEWVGLTAVALGSWYRPTVANGCVYECVSAGTTGAAEPAWPTTPGDEVVDGTVTLRCRAVHCIQTTSDLSGTLSAGMPIRIEQSGSYGYGIISEVSSTHFSVIGGAFENASIDGLWFGSPEKVFQKEFLISGAYGTTTFEILENINRQYVRAGYARTTCVSFEVKNYTDAGTTNPSVNVTIAGTVACSENSDDGLYVSSSWQTVPHGTIVKGATWDAHAALGIECTNAEVADGQSAEDLSVIVIFVVE